MGESHPTPVVNDVFARAQSSHRLEQVRAARELGLLPFFREVATQAGPVVEIEGRERVMLGSNNYLGLTGHPDVKAAAHDALDAYGTALTGSRLLNGTIPLHAELERAITDWLEVEDALVFTTGYQANVGCLGTLLERGDTVICDARDHASVWDGASMSAAKLRRFRHAELDELEAELRWAEARDGGVLVVVDGVYSMEGDVCDLARVTELCRAHGARLMVDEAHGVGVLGARGAGAAEALEVEADVDLRMGTFSKSLASCGGFIAGPAAVIDLLRFEARSFLFTAAAVPAALGAALAAVRICRSDEGEVLFGRLRDNARLLRRGLAELGFEPPPLELAPDGTELVTPIVSVTVGEDWRAAMLWKRLFDSGVYANVALHPAVPRGGALLRMSVIATHEPADLERALEAFQAAARACDFEIG